jgi:hypothetical protein
MSWMGRADPSASDAPSRIFALDAGFGIRVARNGPRVAMKGTPRQCSWLTGGNLPDFISVRESSAD